LISLRFDQLAEMTGGALRNADRAAGVFNGVSIDSRTLRKGELFVAIRGDNLDGHSFVDQAVHSGAAGLMVEHGWPGLEDVGEVPVVAVADSHEAMLTMAARYRNQCPARFVGITGSNGKTTTKELAYHLIRVVDRSVYRSAGNLNNLYGVPLALFATPETARVAIIEMGISTRTEMPRLAGLVHPDIIAITNVGPSHLEFLNSVEAVARAKLELVRQAAPEVPVIVNADDPVLMSETKKVRPGCTTFGIDGKADFRPQAMEVDRGGGTEVTIEGHAFRLPLAGRHQVYNLLAAYAVFRTLGYEFAGVDTGDINLATAPMRGQMQTKKDITFFADCYNANPDSMKAGLTTFFELPGRGRRVVILGDMLELGKAGPGYHQRVGRDLAARDFDLTILVGHLAHYIRDELLGAGVPESRVVYFDKLPPAGQAVAALLRAGDLVMVKASRGIGLEAVIEAVGTEEERA
jgi:UDP-N-acetylmuramoyl-tripeptide--D-alanyl-D-alanine ligase